VPFFIDFTNLTADTLVVRINYLPDNKWQFDDSLTTYSYFDSINCRWFRIPPHSHTPDLRLAATYTNSDSTVDTEKVRSRWEITDARTNVDSVYFCPMIGAGPCPVPWQPITVNRYEVNAGVEVGHWKNWNSYASKIGDWSVIGFQSVNYRYDGLVTDMQFRISGEYTDRFRIPKDAAQPAMKWWYDTLEFYGAPKYHIYDTLFCTYASCSLRVIDTIPMETYTWYHNTFTLRSYDTGRWLAPFLGHADRTFTFRNTSGVAVRLDTLEWSGPDTNSFVLLQRPTTIAPYDSANFVIRLLDNDNRKDLSSYYRGATLMGKIEPADPDQRCTDTTFIITLGGWINVYCPNYPSNPPLLMHGVHPAGIIFSTSTFPNSFRFYMGNNDSLSHLFYAPFFDDSHFGDSISGWKFPTMVLPESIDPFDFPITMFFSEPVHHSYLTKWRWPRDIDTIDIDVLAYDADAPPPPMLVHSNNNPRLNIWPNPASNVIHASYSGSSSVAFEIVDMLGRIVRKANVDSNHSLIELDDLPAGVYQLLVPSSGDAMKLQIIH